LLPDEARYPEGIATDNNGGTFYVSSFSDGSIYRGNLAAGKVKHFLPGGEDGRTQAVGMALDDERRLYIAGGFPDSESTGKVFIYDTTSRKLVRTFSTQSSGFLNDVTVDPNTGDAYITDSFVPILWRVPAEEVTNSPQPGKLEPWLPLTAPIEYNDGFNLNGIVATQNGPYLLTVQSNTGNLYRINTESKEVTLVDLGGATLTNGDGLVLNDHTLYIVRNQDEFITKVLLDNQFASGQVVKETVRDPTFDFPTTAALVDDRLLVVNSQFDEGGPVCPDVKVCPEGEPEIPFTVSSIQAP
jgi:sugar lactone lactonase YvrE